MKASNEEKWFFAIRYFQDDQDVADISNLVVRAARAGYTALALVSGRDYTGNWWDAGRPRDLEPEFRAAHAAADSWWVMSPDRQRRVRAVKRVCDQYGIELVPMVWSVGYNSMRFAEPDISASVPCGDGIAEHGVRRLDLDGAFAGVGVSETKSVSVAVRPQAMYRVNGLVKTSHLHWAEFGGFGCGARCVVSDPDDGGKVIASVSAKGAATRDWTPFSVDFATSGLSTAKIEVGRWWDDSGSCSFRDVTLEEIPCDDWVSRAGERMARKWFADRQSSACMSDPRLAAYFRRSAEVLQNELAPKKWFLSMDEIRVDCECPLCRGMSFGERLGRCLRAEYDAIKAVSPEATIYVWSDMLDPGHNCRDGDPLGYLPQDTVIALWDGRRVKASMDYFTGRGYRVFGAAYYDLQDEASVRENYATWKKLLDASGRSMGLMYTTWAGFKGCTEGDYRFLEAFGE